ncbi:hypothetical protein quinque_002139 [Culex quinquefasciatus]
MTSPDLHPEEEDLKVCRVLVDMVRDQVPRNGSWAIRNMTLTHHSSIAHDVKSALRDIGCEVHQDEEWKAHSDIQIQNEEDSGDIGIFQISQNDGLPQHLCSTCRNDLEAAYAFRVRCECADSNFRKILSLKSEPFIEDDDFKEDKTATFEEDIDSDAPISELLPKSDTDLLDDPRSLYEEQEGSDTGEKDYEVFTCETCGKVLSTFQQYRAHVKAKHELPRKSTEAPKKFCCEKCSLEFKCQSAYQRHISAVHEKRRDYLCKICGEAFAEKYGLRSHQTVHADERYPCSKCPSTFKWKRSLIHHEQLHLPPEERDPKLVKKYKPSKKKYICSFCGKISNNISCHVVHERWHTDERPYNCVTLSPTQQLSTKKRSTVNLASGPSTRFPVDDDEDEEEQKWCCGGCTYLNLPEAKRCSQCNGKRREDVDLFGPSTAKGGGYRSAKAETAKECDPSGGGSGGGAKDRPLRWARAPDRRWPAVGNGSARGRNSQAAAKHSPEHEDNVASNIVLNNKRNQQLAREQEPANNMDVYQQERYMRQLRRQPDWQWLNACIGIAENNVGAVEAFLACGGEPSRMLTPAEVNLLNNNDIAFDVGHTLIHLAIRFHRDEMLPLLLTQISGSGPGIKRVPSYVAPDLASDIRRHFAVLLRIRKASFSCQYVNEHATFSPPADIEELAAGAAGPAL